MDNVNAEEVLWVALAELFFLDNEFGEEEFARVARLTMQNKWTRAQTYEALLKYIAPVAGANLGYLLLPVIGAWSGFDHDFLCAKIKRAKVRRANRPDWLFSISDWWCKRMLRDLGVDNLLNRISP